PQLWRSGKLDRPMRFFPRSSFLTLYYKNSFAQSTAIADRAYERPDLSTASSLSDAAWIAVFAKHPRPWRLLGPDTYLPVREGCAPQGRQGRGARRRTIEIGPLESERSTKTVTTIRSSQACRTSSSIAPSRA